MTRPSAQSLADVRNTADYLIKKLIESTDELTLEQVDRLAEILRPVVNARWANGASDEAVPDAG